MSGRHSAGSVLFWSYLILVISALTASGAFGVFLKILSALILILYLLDEIHLRIKLHRIKNEAKNREALELAQKRQRKNRVAAARRWKLNVVQNNPKSLPTVDIALKRTDKEAIYLLKVLKYVKIHEPNENFYNSNWDLTEDLAVNWKNRLDQKQLLNIFGRKCSYCGAGTNKKNRHLDHVFPRRRGGSNHKLNLLFTCMPCNTSKGDRAIGRFLLEKYQSEERLAPWVIQLLNNKSARRLLNAN